MTTAVWPRKIIFEMFALGPLLAFALGCLIGPQHAPVLYLVNAGLYCSGNSSSCVKFYDILNQELQLRVIFTFDLFPLT